MLYQRVNQRERNKNHLFPNQGIKGPCRKVEMKVELCSEGD